MKIKTRQLGQTDIEITPIGLGVMQFAGGKGLFRMMFPEISQNTMNEIIKAAREGGINWFDTAELYGRGRSEQGLANALHANGIEDENVMVATKWFPLLRKANNIHKTIGDRQRFLTPYSIDLHQVHQPIGRSTPEEEMDAMADLVEAGKIRSVGVSNFDAARMRQAHAALRNRGLTLASNQVQYSLLHRNIETNGVLETAKELGVTIIAWSPIASGLLSGKFHKDPDILKKTPFGRRRQFERQLEHTRPLIDALDKIAANHQVTTTQVALNWLIHAQGETVVAIPGASKPQQAAESAAVMEFQLSDEEISKIDQLTMMYH